VSASNPIESLGSEHVSLIRRHFDRVLASKAFAGAQRSQDFLRLILEHALAGRKDNLKERMIGAEMFGRPIDYDTANDAVVRVKANEVRRRLTQYYAEEGTDRDPVWIELPTGTYVPEFHWNSGPPSHLLRSPTESHAGSAALNRFSKRLWIWLSLVAVSALFGAAMYAILTRTRLSRLGLNSFQGSLVRLTADSGYTTDGAVSADGRLVVYASDRLSGDNLDIYVQDIKTGNVARFTQDPADEYDPVFSPDGSQIAFRSERNGGGIYFMSTLGGAARLFVAGGRGPRFSPDGRYLLYWHAPPEALNKWGGFGAALFVQELTGGSPVQISANCDFVNRSAVWSPDSSQILFVGVCKGRTGIWLASPDGKALKESALYSDWKEQKLESLDPSGAPVFDEWLDNPPRLLTPVRAGEDVSFEASLQIVSSGNSLSGPLQPLLFGPAKITHASASATGRIVLSSVEDSSTIWKLKMDSFGHALDKPVPLTTGSGLDIQPVLSKDGKTLAFASRQAGLWELRTMDLATGALNHVGPRLPYLATPVFNGPGDRINYIGQSPDSKTRADYEVQVEGGVPETLFENAVGGIWDTSPTEGWLLTHSTYQNATPRTGYADAGLGHSVSVADRVSLHTTLFLSDPSNDVFQAHFSHDGKWVAFNRVNNQHSQIYVAPFRTELVPTANWIRVTDSTWDDKPRFSWDDRLIFFISDRDGFRCIWAQRLTSDMHPTGDPFAVYHSHSFKRSIGNLPIGRFEMAVGPGILVFNQADYHGDLWLLDRK